MLMPMSDVDPDYEEDPGLYPNVKDCPKELRERIVKMFWEESITPRQIHNETNVCSNTIEEIIRESSNDYKKGRVLHIASHNPVEPLVRILNNNRVWQNLVFDKDTKITEIIEVRDRPRSKSTSEPNLRVDTQRPSTSNARSVQAPRRRSKKLNTPRFAEIPGFPFFPMYQMERVERCRSAASSRELVTRSTVEPVYPQLLTIGQDVFKLEPDVEISKVTPEERERYRLKYGEPKEYRINVQHTSRNQLGSQRSIESSSSKTSKTTDSVITPKELSVNAVITTQSLDRYQRRAKRRIDDLSARLMESSLTSRARSEVPLSWSQSGSLSKLSSGQQVPIDLSLPKAESVESLTRNQPGYKRVSSKGARPKTIASRSRTRRRKKSQRSESSDESNLPYGARSLKSPIKMRRPIKSDLSVTYQKSTNPTSDATLDRRESTGQEDTSRPSTLATFDDNSSESSGSHYPQSEFSPKKKQHDLSDVDSSDPLTSPTTDDYPMSSRSSISEQGDTDSLLSVPECFARVGLDQAESSAQSGERTDSQATLSIETPEPQSISEEIRPSSQSIISDTESLNSESPCTSAIPTATTTTESVDKDESSHSK